MLRDLPRSMRWTAAIATATIALAGIWLSRLPEEASGITSSAAQAATAGAPKVMLPPALQAPEAPLPPPSVDLSGLRVFGVLSDAGGEAAAIIGKTDGPQQLVGVGREILPGARLHAVGIDRVTIATGRQLVDLPLGDPTAANAPVPAVIAPSPIAAPDVGDLVNYRLGLTPAAGSDRVSGYRIAPGASLPVFVRAGLRPGDLVLAVNGTPLQNEEALLELPAEMAAATAIEIEFERNGQRSKVTVPR